MMSARAGTLAPEILAPEILAPETSALLGLGKALLECHEAAGEVRHSAATLSAPACELLRGIYCQQGIPVDAVDMLEVVRRIETAAAMKSLFLFQVRVRNFCATVRNVSPNHSY
jgi:hypothetical protein